MNHPPDSNPPRDAPHASTATSRSLIERLRADDAGAWERLLGLYAPLVVRWCRRWDLPDQDVADISQDVFQAVAAHLASFRKEQEGDTFRGWLRTITRNKVRDHYRKTAREPGGAGGTEAQIRISSLPAAPAPDAGDSSDEGRAEQDLFHRALEAIREDFEARTWQAFWLTAVEDRIPKDVGIELGMTPGAVRVAKSRVLRRLRDELGD